MGELVAPDVDEVDDVDGQHRQANDHHCQRVVEERRVERHEGVQNGVPRPEVAVRAPLVDRSLEPVVVEVDREGVAQRQSEKCQLGAEVDDVPADGAKRT